MLAKTLIAVGPYKFRTRHLIVIAVLALAVTVSALMRVQPAEHGYMLNEYDPFFNYRATEFLLENGLEEYGMWHDELSWYPDGRDISKTSQFMQHATAAVLYTLFGGGADLEDFVIMLPVILGALTSVAVFATVRVIGGTSAGLFASLFYAISLPVILRGSVGWFKAEPLGLFYGIIGVYLLLSGLTCGRNKEALARLVGAGIVMSMGLSAWGGIQFFIIPLGIFILALPFLRADHKFLLWAIPLFSLVLLGVTSMFERPGIGFTLGLGGVSLGITTAVMVGTIMLWRASKKHGARNAALLVLAIVGISVIIIGANATYDYLDLPSFRYLNAINPLLTSTIPLIDSVSEHTSLTPYSSFFFSSILMIFAGIGAWLLISRREKIDSYGLPMRTDMIAYAILLGFAGVYIASAFTRLVLFSSVAMAVLGSIGLAILVSLVFSNKRVGRLTKLGFAGVVIVMFAVPLVHPADANWVSLSAGPPILLTGGTLFEVVTDDWPQALEWIKTETPKDSLIMAWWDYGYWIQTLGERATLVDNLTISTSKVENVAKIFYSDLDTAWMRLNDLEVDYVVVFVSARAVGSNDSFYVLQGGGDETKKAWIVRIAGLEPSEYAYADSITPTPKFEETTLGQMIPFTHFRYVHIDTGLQSVMWQEDFVSVVHKDIKLPSDSDGPFRLAYSSPSFDRPVGVTVTGVFVYELNPDYVPAPIDPLNDLNVLTPFIEN